MEIVQGESFHQPHLLLPYLLAHFMRRPCIQRIELMPNRLAVVLNQESARVNMLPLMLARAFSKHLGGRVAEGVYQLSGGGNTGVTGGNRAKRDHDFEGTVELGSDEVIVLVDDVFTSGNTLTALYDHLDSQWLEDRHVFT
jgi:hypothetical protein